MSSIDRFKDRMQFIKSFNDDDSDVGLLVYCAYAEAFLAFKDGKLTEFAKMFKQISLLCNDNISSAAAVYSSSNPAFKKVLTLKPEIKEIFKDEGSLYKFVSLIEKETGYADFDYDIRKLEVLRGVSYDNFKKSMGIDNKAVVSDVETEEEIDIDSLDLDDIVLEDDEAEEYEEEQQVEVESLNEDNEYDEEVEYELNGTREEGLEQEGDGTDDIKYSEADVAAAKNMAEKQGAIRTLDVSSMSESEDEEIDTSDVEYIEDIDEVIAAILNRNEAVFRSCLELDRPYGMLYEKGLLTYKVVDGSLHYVPGIGKGRSVFENLYAAIINGTGAKLITAQDLRNVPNAKNIGEKGYNYYPGYIFKYALGLVDDKKHTSWSKFQSSVKESLYKKLKALYKKGLFFENMDKIEKLFSTSILVLSYEGGAGIKLRVSLPGVSIDTSNLEKSIRNVTTYKSAGITITQVNGYMDVVDVQVYLQEDKFLDRPYWAYKAMRLKLDNGEPISLSDGLPIGRRVNGDIVEFKLDPSNRFLTFLAAGSGAGKGVLTLSLVAAAIGSSVPMFYMDYKPDMAPIFWNIEKRYKINTFTYDGMVKKRPNSNNKNHTQGFGMPAEVSKALGKYSGAILYLKAVQLMCAMAQYRADVGAQNDIMFVFDETQAMQRLIKNAVEKTVALKKEHTPAKVKGVEQPPDKVYTYTSILLDWFKEVNVNIDTYVNTTGRKSNTFCIFIAQSPDYSTWTNLKAKTDNGQIELLSRITFADTIFKILGRGSTTSKYGLGGDGKKAVTAKELKYVANNRFFGMYDGKTTDGADITIFKPFLTLNTDNPMDKCWTKGMGKKFGYGSIPDEQYKRNVAQEHPGEAGYTNADGIHTGTGLLGLASMYCNGNVEKITKNFASGWDYCIEFFKATGLSNKYSNPSDYMYDTSLDGLMMINNMISYNPANENSAVLGVDASSSLDSDSNDTDNENDRNPVNMGKIPGLDENNKSNERMGSVVVNKSSDDLMEEAAFSAMKMDANQQQEMNVDDTVQSIISNTPDGSDPLDYLSHTLNQDVKDGVISKDTASKIAEHYDLAGKGYANSNQFTGEDNYIRNDNREVNNKVHVEKDGEQASSSFGSDGQYTRIDTSKTSEFTHLNDDNSVDCRRAILKEPKFITRMMLKTPSGAEKYVKNIWKQVLSDIKNQGYSPALITRVSMWGGHLYVNGKIVMLDGILGGRQNIRLKDIVDYGLLFKRFPMIKDLRLDEEMLQSALMELGENSINGLFSLGKKLENIFIKRVNGEMVVIRRQDAMTSRTKEVEKRAKASNDIDMYCRSKRSKSWDSYTPGENIAAFKLAKSSFSRASQSFLNKNKPSLGWTLLYGSVGTVAGALGGAWWGLSNGVKYISRVSKSFGN